MTRTRTLTLLCFASLTSTLLTGCTPTQISDTQSVLQTALADFTQNRSLTEQYVRDVKARVDPSDPAYVQAMESYQDARDSFNRYLDVLESGKSGGQSRSLSRTLSSVSVEGAAEDFISDATRAMRPNDVRHRGEFRRSVVIPEDLQSAVAKVPKKIRNRMVDQFDDQVRWRSWGQL